MVNSWLHVTEARQRDERKITPEIEARSSQDVRPNRVEADSQPVTILFRIRDRNGRWETAHEVLVDRADPNRQATFYDNLRKLTPAECFEGAIEDDTNTIFLDLKGELAINEDTLR
ncbi:hypothetical protein BDW75DRAFT_235352 [Aspergillus navahoensis]